VPVVTVCGAGKTSLIAAEHLQARGVQARSLKGGMQAWSLAWNAAELTLPGSAARVIQVRRTGKGCLSYLIGADGNAVVIDPSLDPDVYRGLAQRQGWRITHVLETHLHADHLSRARALAEHSGAALLLPARHRVAAAFTPLTDGETIAIGAARLTVLHTPGHTPESSCYLLDDTALFTGDTLFLSAVGRPDLHASQAGARAKAQALYRSLQRLLQLDPGVLVLPGHTSEPIAFNGQPIAAPLGAVRESLPLLHEGEARFANTILARIPPTPPNHEQIIAFNEAGKLPEGDPTVLEAGANRCAVA
jgi:glyoxylase-like metal-dependent hydrolase (beta-lactamase superfamily II)